jgi:hypothetical protein
MNHISDYRKAGSVTRLLNLFEKSNLFNLKIEQGLNCTACGIYKIRYYKLIIELIKVNNASYDDILNSKFNAVYYKLCIRC